VSFIVKPVTISCHAKEPGRSRVCGPSAKGSRDRSIINIYAFSATERRRAWAQKADRFAVPGLPVVAATDSCERVCGPSTRYALDGIALSIIKSRRLRSKPVNETASQKCRANSASEAIIGPNRLFSYKVPGKNKEVLGMFHICGSSQNNRFNPKA
jgi:hypothetical protein